MSSLRLSIRGMALLVTGAALVFAVASQPAALVGVFLGLLSIVAALLMQGYFFAIGSAFGRWLGPIDVVARTSRGGVEHSSLARTAARPAESTISATPGER